MLAPEGDGWLAPRAAANLSRDRATQAPPTRERRVYSRREGAMTRARTARSRAEPEGGERGEGRARRSGCGAERSARGPRALPSALHSPDVPCTNRVPTEGGRARPAQPCWVGAASSSSLRHEGGCIPAQWLLVLHTASFFDRERRRTECRVHAPRTAYRRRSSHPKSRRAPGRENVGWPTSSPDGRSRRRSAPRPSRSGRPRTRSWRRPSAAGWTT